MQLFKSSTAKMSVVIPWKISFSIIYLINIVKKICMRNFLICFSKIMHESALRYAFFGQRSTRLFSVLWIKSFYISFAKIKLWSFLVYRDSISIFLPAKCSVDICMSRNIVWDFKKQLTTSNMKALVKMCNFAQVYTSCKLIELKLICSSCIIPHYLIHRIKGQKTKGSPFSLRLKPRI